MLWGVQLLVELAESSKAGPTAWCCSWRVFARAPSAQQSTRLQLLAPAEWLLVLLLQGLHLRPHHGLAGGQGLQPAAGGVGAALSELLSALPALPAVPCLSTNAARTAPPCTDGFHGAQALSAYARCGCCAWELAPQGMHALYHTGSVLVFFPAPLLLLTRPLPEIPASPCRPGAHVLVSPMLETFLSCLLA
jgi:hypothetical protein